MALARRGGQRFNASIWPGFVDAMTALLLVLTFVLSIFMIVQFVLRETITGQDEELNDLSQQIAGLADALGLEKDRTATLESDLSETRLSLSSTQDNLLTTEEQLAQARDQVSEQFAIIQGLIAEGNRQKEQIAALETTNARELSEKEAAQLALAQARTEIDEAAEAARLAAAKREALEALVADLEGNIAETSEKLSETETARLAEAAAAAALRDRLANSQDELTAMSLALEEKRKEAENTLTLLAAAQLAKSQADELLSRLNAAQAAATDENAALADQNEALSVKTASLEETITELLARVNALEGEKETLETSNAAQMTEKERQDALLAAANRALSEEKALSAESQRQLALMNAQTVEMRNQLAELQGLLDAAAAKDIESQVQIEALGQNLNTALARVASEQKKLAAEQAKLAEEQRLRAELEEAERIRLEEEAKDLRKFRSEFFGQLRDVMEGLDGVQIVGDRFVFSSEVLFAPGSAVLGAEGQNEISKVAGLIRAIADEIPPEIDWMLRVDGHTDRVPLNGNGQFRDNWELSQGRALSVVKFLSEQENIPAGRLSANGFGEFQPIDPADTPAAYATNRRIELKFTEK